MVVKKKKYRRNFVKYLIDVAEDAKIVQNNQDENVDERKNNEDKDHEKVELTEEQEAIYVEFEPINQDENVDERKNNEDKDHEKVELTEEQKAIYVEFEPINQDENVDERKNNEDKDHEKVELTEEQKAILQTVMVGDLNKLDFIEVKASKRSLKQALESNKPEEALCNVDDLLVANKYFSKNDGYKKRLDSIIEGQLNALLSNPDTISPDNATAYVALCKSCGNQELCDKVLAVIADALIKYDKEKFGNKDADVLLKDYEKLQEQAAKIDPFAKNDDPNKDLSGTVFSNTKKGKEQKDAVSSLAREMAVQRLTAKGSYTAEELEEEIRKSAENIIKASGANVRDGNYVVNSNSLASTIANQYVEIEGFKTRCEQKFKNSKIAKTVTKKVNKIDKELTDKFGKSYVFAKKALKFTSKIAVGVTKSSALWAIAGAVPGGPAVLMGYYMYKGIKDTYKDLKDSNKTKLEKVCSVVKTGFTTMLYSAGISSGLQEGAEVLAKAGFENASQILDGAGKVVTDITSNIASLGGTICSQEVISSAITNVNMYTRMGVIAATSTLPNLMKASSLAIKEFSIKSKIKKASKKGDGKEVSKLLKQQKEIKAQRNANYKEFGCKAVGIVGGMLMARAIAPVVNQSINSVIEKGEDVLKAASAQMGVKELLNQGVDHQQGKTDFRINFSHESQSVRGDSLTNDSINSLNTEIQEKQEQFANFVKESGIKGGFTIEEGKSGEIEINYTGQNAAKEDLEVLKGKAQEIFDLQDKIGGDGESKIVFSSAEHGSAETKGVEQTLEQKSATNLAEAKTANSSGIEGKSSFDHTKSLLNFDSRITDTDTVATKLCESFGNDANKVVIACRMAPYALHDALGLNEVENPKSYNMVDYITEHPLTAEQSQALDKFLNDNFEGTRFMTEKYPDWNYQKNPVVENRQVQVGETVRHDIPKIDVPDTGNRLVDNLNDKWACSDGQGRGFRFEGVGGQAQQRQAEEYNQPQQQSYSRQPVVDARDVATTLNLDMTKPYNYSDPFEYATNMGLRYDARLSNGIDRFGDGVTFDGYAGAFVDMNNPNNIVYLPNNMQDDYGKITSLGREHAMNMQADLKNHVSGHGTGPYNHGGHTYKGMCPDRIVSSRYGCGGIMYDEHGIFGKIDRFVNGVSHVLGGVNQVLGSVTHHNGGSRG